MSATARSTEELRLPRDERGYDEPGLVQAVLSRLEPEEGWISLLLAVILAGTMAWSIADARWVLGRDGLSSFVIWIAVAGALWGWLSARLDMSPWLAHLLGASIGAFLLIEAVGSVLPDAQPGIVGWFQATANSVTQAYLDLTWRHQISTNQYGHFCLFIGILVWGTAQAAAYDIFGYHRAVTGVLLMAVVFIANLSLTYRDQFWALVLFSAAALGVLLLAHAAEERSGWLRHRIWRGGDFKAPHLQGGLTFAAGAVFGALLLTSVASPAPLADAWPQVTDNFREFAVWLSAYLPSGGQSRINPGSDFGSSTTVSWSFSAGPENVFTIKLPDQSATAHWRVVAYDEFKSTGWSIGTGPAQTQIPAGSSLTAGTLDQVTAATQGRVALTYVVHVQDKSIRHLISANEPSTVSVATGRIGVGASSSDQDVVWFPTNALDYTVNSYVPDMNPLGSGLTEWRLRHAGAAWPPGILKRYTQGADLVGSDGKYLLALIKQWATSQGYAMDSQTGRFASEYDAAKAIQDYLRDPDNFTYRPDITDNVRRCSSLSTVDCFALYREGFCEQYATTMTMLLRMDGFPARYVQGFLPGRLTSQYTLIEQVTAQQRHAWVEVFFPGYGWIPFDPTGGSVGQPTELPAGSAVQPSPSPGTSGDAGRSPRPNGTPKEPGGNDTPAGTTSDSGPGGMLVPAALALIALVALVLLWRRRPRRLHAPDTVYRGIVRLASRLGYKPLPTQTVYEYTGMLADIVPRARDPLGVVATAEVEVTYGRRQLGDDRLVALDVAEQRVRSALLRLVLRLPGRGPKRPKPKGSGRRR